MSRISDCKTEMILMLSPRISRGSPKRKLKRFKEGALTVAPSLIRKIRQIRAPKPFLFLLSAIALTSTSCGNGLGPSVAVTLNLYSVDGVIIPAPFKSAGGKSISIGNGRLQGTSWGHACGMSLQLIEGPITAVDVPDCKLAIREEKRFTSTLTDSRFPAGAHEYRFVP